MTTKTTAPIDWPDLKPCPFCAKVPETPACYKSEEYGGRWAYIECTNCGARCGDIRANYKPVYEWSWVAAEEWNHRT